MTAFMRPACRAIVVRERISDTYAEDLFNFQQVATGAPPSRRIPVTCHRCLRLALPMRVHVQVFALVELDAIILAEDPLARVRIAGLARARASRASRAPGRCNTRRSSSITTSIAQACVAWRAGRTRPLLVIRADQLVHTPLVAPLSTRCPRPASSLSRRTRRQI